MNRIAPVQTMNMSVGHHWAVWSFAGDGVVSVYCSDCDQEVEFDLSVEQALREYVHLEGDIQIVSWIEVREKGFHGKERNAV